jgi:hypothetical protein
MLGTHKSMQRAGALSLPSQMHSNIQSPLALQVMLSAVR